MNATGVGPIVFGTTVAQANASGAHLLVPPAVRGDACYYVRPRHVDGVRFLVEDGNLRRAEVTTPSIATTDGIRVGNSLATLRRRYGTLLRLSPDKYDPAVRLARLGSSSAPRGAVIFRIVAGSVRAINSGLLPQIDYVEGCG